ncbi:MAG: hypothetical protein ACKN83_10345 [Vulcanococcus sp.]
MARLTRSLLLGLAMATAAAAAPPPAPAYDLQYRQNGISFSAPELQRLFNAALPATYDRVFPEQRWTTYLLLDVQAGKGLTAITLGLSPRLDQRRALLPVATFSVIEPMPTSREGWERLLSGVINRYGSEMVTNRSRIQ